MATPKGYPQSFDYALLDVGFEREECEPWFIDDQAGHAYSGERERWVKQLDGGDKLRVELLPEIVDGHARYRCATLDLVREGVAVRIIEEPSTNGYADRALFVVARQAAAIEAVRRIDLENAPGAQAESPKLR